MNATRLPAMKSRSISPVLSAVAAILFAENPNLLACEEMPGQLEIGVSGATQSPDDPNYYVVRIPEEGEAAVDVTITGSGEVPCPADCVCEADGSVTAAPAESGDPDYTFTHAAGTQNGDKIEWSIDSSETPGHYTFQLTKKSQGYEDCPAGYTGGSASESNQQASDEVTVLAFSAMIDVDVENDLVSDGTEGVHVDVVITPSSVESSVSNVSLSAEKPNGDTSFANPDGQGIDLEKRGDGELAWEMLNVRWYEDDSVDCTSDLGYWFAPYHVGGTFDLAGGSFNLANEEFFAEAPGLGNNAFVDRHEIWWDIDGSTALVSMITVTEHTNGNYLATVDASDFSRNVQATANVGGSFVGSQFYQMAIDEENHHVSQLEDGVDAVDPDIHWSAKEVKGIIHGEDAQGMTEEEARIVMLNYVEGVVHEENDTSETEVLEYPSDTSLRCSLEAAAKNAVSADYPLAYECNYLECD